MKATEGRNLGLTYVIFLKMSVSDFVLEPLIPVKINGKNQNNCMILGSHRSKYRDGCLLFCSIKLHGAITQKKNISK
jgi:hypothetical protein